jgi:hypothetical protein
VEQNSIATKEPSRFGGECYTIACPYHYRHSKGEEPLCNAENAVITDEEFKDKAPCQWSLERLKL